MATLEQEQPIRRGPARPHEQHVFVSADGRRQSALRAAGLVAGGLALFWLVALGLALAGSTRLPGLPVSGAKARAAREASAASAATPARAHSHARVHVAPARTATPRRPEPQRAAATARPARPVRAIPPATRAVPVAPATSTTSQAPTTATPTQGWARRGLTAPPGQTKRNEPTPRGTGRSTDAGTTSTTRGNGHGKG